MSPWLETKRGGRDARQEGRSSTPRPSSPGLDSHTSAVLLVVVLCILNVCRTLGAQELRADFYKFLPRGAAIANPGKDIVLADLDGDGQKEVVIFYVLGVSPDDRPAILVLKRRENSYEPMWQRLFDAGHGFQPPTGVYDLNKTGLPQIVSYRPVGASCDAQLDVFEYQGGMIRRVVAWHPGICQASLEIKDLDGDGVPEIIFTTRNTSSNPDIYRWDGWKYALASGRYPNYYNGRLREMLTQVRADKPVPAVWRMQLVGQIVQIYSLQRRYPDIIRLCEDVLPLVDDSRFTVPNSVISGKEKPGTLKLIQTSFQREKTAAKSELHRYEGDAYRALGNEQKAELQYHEARTLGSTQ